MIFVIILFFMGLSLLVGWRLKAKVKEYSKIPLRSGLTGREVAEKMLRDNGIYDVQVMSVPGQLTDHYNPVNKTVNLSPEIYSGRNIAAAAIAAHEVGHAVQHATAYNWLEFRSKLVPVVSFSSQIINFIFIASFLMAGVFSIISIESALLIVIACQAFITLFALVTLPVEFDATSRGLMWLNSAGLTYGEEHIKAQKALNLAALTYVIAALSALATLLYYIMIFLNRRD